MSTTAARQPALDGVRGIAVLIVVCSHFGYLGRVAGGTGVTIFFALSGYLITRILIESYSKLGTGVLRRFYLRRARRLLPALWLMLAVFAVARLVIIGPGELPGFAAAAVYVSNFGQNAPLELSHLWSLSVEEQFYIVWPVVLFALLRTLGRRGALWSTLTLIAALNAWRVFLWLHGADTGWWRLYGQSDTRSDEILIGAAVALAPQWPHWLRLPLLVPATVIVAILFLGHAYSDAWYALAGETVIALCVAAAITARTSRVLENPVLVHFGKLSYGLYLWHLPLISWFYHETLWGMTDAANPVRLVLLGGICWSVALLSYELIERRFTGAPTVLTYAANRPPALDGRPTVILIERGSLRG